MIIIRGLCKSFGKRAIFDNVSLNINKGEKIGLVGPNGAGKSTLFGLILGDVGSFSGGIDVAKDIHIGYLPQESSFASQNTVLVELIEGDKRIAEFKREKEELEENNQAGSMRYGDVLHSLEVLGYFELEHKAKKILMEEDFLIYEVDTSEFMKSGGSVFCMKMMFY